MRLYINGELAGEGRDDQRRCPPGCDCSSAGCIPLGNVRPFKGQLDELALYDRALKPRRDSAALPPDPTGSGDGAAAGRCR